jgi:hypothetical protein
MPRISSLRPTKWTQFSAQLFRAYLRVVSSPLALFLARWIPFTG